MVLELQHQCADALTAITTVEWSKSLIPRIAALTLTGSVFAVDADLTFLSVVLGTSAIIGSVAGYFSYGRLEASRTAKLTPLIDRQYELVFQTATSRRAVGLIENRRRVSGMHVHSAPQIVT